MGLSTYPIDITNCFNTNSMHIYNATINTIIAYIIPQVTSPDFWSFHRFSSLATLLTLNLAIWMGCYPEQVQLSLQTQNIPKKSIILLSSYQ